jgi:hypothetical protein
LPAQGGGHGGEQQSGGGCLFEEITAGCWILDFGFHGKFWMVGGFFNHGLHRLDGLSRIFRRRNFEQKVTKETKMNEDEMPGF